MTLENPKPWLHSMIPCRAAIQLSVTLVLVISVMWLSTQVL